MAFAVIDFSGADEIQLKNRYSSAKRWAENGFISALSDDRIASVNLPPTVNPLEQILDHLRVLFRKILRFMRIGKEVK